MPAIQLMDIDKFIENFTDLFDETDPATISATTQFKSLDEWSSLVALSVIAMVDEEYDVEFRGDDIRGSNTVEDLYNIVKNRVE
jgi:acyl carrier protein